MGNIIAFACDRSAPQRIPGEALIDATQGLLHANAELAMAIKSVMDRLLRLEAEVAGIASGRPGRLIDMVIEQDRTRLVGSMADVLDSIREYASGVENRIRDASKNA